MCPKEQFFAAKAVYSGDKEIGGMERKLLKNSTKKITRNNNNNFRGHSPSYHKDDSYF